ncbi:MAG TPA: hypothetical protein VNQ76_09400 [Planctomicrobium sp.]|nr:hypothetical protein [Planctomicrobium sp.]
MRTGNLQSASGRLQEALDDLQQSWQATRSKWNDQQADYLEQTYLKKIEEEVVAAFPVIGLLSQTFGAAHRDCSE